MMACRNPTTTTNHDGTELLLVVLDVRLLFARVRVVDRLFLDAFGDLPRRRDADLLHRDALEDPPRRRDADLLHRDALEDPPPDGSHRWYHSPFLGEPCRSPCPS